MPYHLDERLPALEVGGVPVDREVTAPLPEGGPWQRMAVLYERVAEAVAAELSAGDGAAPLPVVVSGDCTTSLGVLAGLQRAGRDPGVVWFDAHADFHTEASTTSGYLGGLPLALAVGVGTPTLPTMLGLRPVPEQRAVLVDARDTDPGEHDLLERSAVVRSSVADLDASALPDGDLYLHLDLDVVDPADPAQVPDLLYPAPGGPALDDVLAAVRRVLASGRVVAVGVAATWHHERGAAAAGEDLVRRVVQAAQAVRRPEPPSRPRG